jgi:Spy/CpxP family protein refolding chaperone
MKTNVSLTFITALCAIALTATASLHAGPPSKNQGRQFNSQYASVFPAVTELSRLFDVNQMIKIKALVKEYSPRAEPKIDQVIDANRHLSRAVLAYSPSERAIRAGTDNLANARAKIALLQVEFLQDLRKIARPDQMDRLAKINEIAFERIHLLADKAAWVVETF